MRRIHIPIMLLLALYLVGHYGPRVREAVGNLTEVTHAQGYPSGNHYAPREDLERLDMEVLNYVDAEARRSGGQTLDICMYSLTDRRLAAKLRELAQHGVTERIYRDGREYEEEQQRAGRRGSAMGLLIGLPNVHIRVKPASRTELMHLNYVSRPVMWCPAFLRASGGSLLVLDTT
ncbi:MAG: hypothetical protein ACLQOO_24830 [Terriglobia bacterium]